MPFRIHRIHDDVTPADAAAIAEVQAILRAQFPTLSDDLIAKIPKQLRDPLQTRFRSILLVAERRHAVVGFALFMIAPDERFAWLDFISAAHQMTGRGLGGVLYARVREEARLLGADGLFFECLPDDPALLEDPATLAANKARLRFYEGFGARPIEGTAYQSPVSAEDTDMPLLVLDDLGTGNLPGRDRARAIVRAILQRKYGWLCPPEYIERVVGSITDDPIRLRPPRYTRPTATPDPAARKPALPEHARVMLIVNPEHDIHHVRVRGYVEAPARIAAIERELEALGEVIDKRPRKHYPDKHIHAVHDPEFVRYLEATCQTLPPGKSVYPYVFPIRNQARPPVDLALRAGYYCIDTFTPLNRNAWPAARNAVDCALTGAEAICTEDRHLAYALVRPPGHHAERRVFGGFCYLATAAAAAHYLSRHGKVALLDIDYHHGNGQQDIFYERADVFTVSIHGHPSFAYPYFSGFEDETGRGEGEGYNLNIPLPEQIDGPAYREPLKRALEAIRAFAPKYLVVCLGLDTALRDPTGTFSLRADDFHHNGALIGALGLPTLMVQEGGYDTRTLGRNARRFVQGIWSASFPAAR